MKDKKAKMNFDSLPASLATIVTLTQKQLKEFVKYVLNVNGYFPVCGDGYVYAAGNIPVMLVAHMDTVHKEPVKEIYVSNFGNVTSPQGIGGDDRCGVYSIFSIIADLKPYVLFTEDEETGGVGANKFVYEYQNDPQKLGNIDIDFMIEIDRQGNNDAVYYDCDNPEFEKLISGYGYKTQWGSFSDISVIAPELGVAAVNLSSGYYKAHTTSEYINVPELEHTIEIVKQILSNVPLKKNRKKYEYIPAIRKIKNSWHSYWDEELWDRPDAWERLERQKYEESYYYVDDVPAAIIPDGSSILDFDEEEIPFEEGEYCVGENGAVYFYDPCCDGYIETDYLAFTMDGVMLNANMLPEENRGSIPVYNFWDEEDEEDEYEEYSVNQLPWLDEINQYEGE